MIEIKGRGLLEGYQYVDLSCVNNMWRLSNLLFLFSLVVECCLIFFFLVIVIIIVDDINEVYEKYSAMKIHFVVSCSNESGCV